MQINAEIPNKLLPLLEKHKRLKVLVGGRGSAKSDTVAACMAMFAYNGEKICCIRELQNSIEESVHSTINSTIERLEIPGFTSHKTAIEHSSSGKIVYRGLSRNPDSVKSMSEIDRWWCEEAQSLSADSLGKLIPTARKSAGKSKIPEIWFTMNRGSSTDPASQELLKPYEKELKKNNGYYEDDLIMIIECNWQDNPWFIESGLNTQRLKDEKRMTPAKYNHIWGGDYDDDVENSIIETEWFDACIDSHLALGFEARGAEVVSFDPSDEGGDAKGLAYRHGVVFKDVQEWNDGNIFTGLDKALDYVVNKKVDLFTWDGDGLGAPLRRDVAKALDGKRIDWVMFKGSESPEFADKIYLPDAKASNDNYKDEQKTNKETFKNKRAQRYMELADRCRRTYEAVVLKEYHDPDNLISFSSEIEHMDLLRSEICRIPRKPNVAGLIQIMGKPDMKRIGIASPNMADAVMMALETPEMKRKTRSKIKYPKAAIA